MLESFEKPLPDSIELFLNEEDIWSSYVNQVLGEKASFILKTFLVEP